MSEAPKRRWLRFSLRTILLLVLVVAVILGYSVSRFARERRAVESILSRYGRVVYHDDAYGRVHPERTLKAWFREFVGLRWPGEVYLEGGSITDDVLRDAVLPLRTVQAVGLTGVAVTNEGLAQLRPLKSLVRVTCLRDSRNEHVLEALDERSYVDMHLTPLRDAMDYFADYHDITIVLDRQAFQLQTDSMVITGTMKNRSPISPSEKMVPPALNLRVWQILSRRTSSRSVNSEKNPMRRTLSRVSLWLVETLARASRREASSPMRSKGLPR